MLCCFQEKWLCLYPLLSVASIFMMSLILFRFFGRCYPVLIGLMPPIMLLGDRVFHILVTRDPLCELSLAG
jgi:hypothetical protein